MQNLTNTQAWQYLTNGSVFDAVINMYESAPIGAGMGDVFWFILFLISVIIMYIKTENNIMTVIYTLLGLTVMTSSLLSVKYHWLVWTIAVISLATSLFIVFYQKNK